MRVGACVSLVAAFQLIFVGLVQAQIAAPLPPPPPAPLPPPYNAYPPPPLRQPMNGPVVQLRVDNRRARLQLLQFKWLDICYAPCGVAVDPGGTYRISGQVITPSANFGMPRSSGPVFIDVKTGSLVKHWVGVGLSIGALVAAGVGGLYLLAASSVNTNNSDNGLNNGNDVIETGFKVYGIVFLVTGVVLAAIGVPMWMGNGTEVHVQ